MPVASSTPAHVMTEAIFDFWQRMAEFHASEAEAALTYLQEWIAEAVDADNVIWIGGVRVLRGAAAKKDPFLGWRLRSRVALRPDPAPYRKQLSEYYESEHYGKLTPTYYQRSHEAKDADHIGMDSRASMEGNGRFRVWRIRDGPFDFAAFEKTPHYQRYYLEGGIIDRMLIGCPVTPDHESYFMVDRFRSRTRRRLFSLRDATLAGDAARGVPFLHRRLLLNNGLLRSDKVLSPVERQILQGLLTGYSEKELAVSTGQKLSTLHKYVTGLYALYGVTSRPALMALWLGGK